MAFNVNDMIIDRPIRATLFDKTSGEVIFTIDQVTDPSLEATSESAEVRDATGSLVTEFERSKTVVFSGSNSFVNLGLLAAQTGSSKEVASATNLINVPKFEMIELGNTAGTPNATITLSEEPVGTLKYIYRLANDKSIAEKFEVGVDDTSDFSIAGKVITLPTTPTTPFVSTDRFSIWYEYETDGTNGLGSVRISSFAEVFARVGKFDLEILLADICNPNVKYYAHLVGDNAKIDGNFSITFNNEATHPFSVKIMQNYCDAKKKLFDIIIPE